MKGLSGCLGRSLIILLGIGAIIWGLWSWFAPTAVVRYRLDVTVEVDGEPVTGSVVQELTISTWPFHLPGNARVGYRIKGQALVLDLPRNVTLFVLMESYCPGKSTWGQCKGQYAHLIAVSCDVKRGRASFASYVRKFKHLAGSCEIPEDKLPVMVRFDDEAEQSSARLVAPQQLADVYGEDIRFVSASITITDEAVSTGIEKRLSWFSPPAPVSYRPYIIDENGTKQPFFPRGSFRRFPR